MVKPPKIDRQREHQANERTFLAWLRTALALIGLGLAIARFSLFLRQLQTSMTQYPSQEHPFWNSENLGVSLIVVGVVTIALAAWRYNQVFWQIEKGDYRSNRLMVWAMTAVVMILGILSIPLLLKRPSPPLTRPPTQQNF